MKVTKVCCQGCGADLEVDESIKYVTCNYCGARLEVVHDATVTHTRQLDKIEKTTDRMANNLRVIELQNDLERLDREWETQRSGMMWRDKQGNVHEPSAAGCTVSGGIAIAFGIFWMVGIGMSGAPPFFAIFGMVFIAVALFGMARGSQSAETYRTRLDEYQVRRQGLLKRLDDERQAD